RRCGRGPAGGSWVSGRFRRAPSVRDRRTAGPCVIQDEQSEPLGGQRRTRLAFDLDEVAGADQQATVIAIRQLRQSAVHANPGPHFHRVDPAYPIQSVIQRVGHVDWPHADLVREMSEHGKRPETERDRSPIRCFPRRPCRVHMQPVQVLGGLGELVDHRLLNLQPSGHAQYGTYARTHVLDGVGRAHHAAPARAANKADCGSTAAGGPQPRRCLPPRIRMSAAATQMIQSTGVMPACGVALNSMCGTTPASSTLPRTCTNSQVMNTENETTVPTKGRNARLDCDMLPTKKAGKCQMAQTMPSSSDALRASINSSRRGSAKPRQPSSSPSAPGSTRMRPLRMMSGRPTSHGWKSKWSRRPPAAASTRPTTSQSAG